MTLVGTRWNVKLLIVVAIVILAVDAGLVWLAWHFICEFVGGFIAGA